MSTNFDQQTPAGEEAAIPTGAEAEEQPGITPEGAEAAVSGNAEQTAQDPPSDEAPAGETPAAAEETETEIQTRPSLADIAAKRAEEREKEESDADDESAAAEEGKPEAEKTEAGKPADEKADPDDLKVEDVDKVHEKDSPSARERIKALAQTRDNLKAQLQPALETLELLGGQDGVNEILEKLEVIENPARADEFLDLVEKSPNFQEFKTKHFWGELDNPATQALVVADQFGEDVTLEKLQRLVAAEKRGLIDLDEIEDREDSFKLTDEELAAKRTERTEAQRLAAENAELKKKVGDKDTETAQAATAQRWNEFGSGYDAELFPMLQEFNVLPLPDDAPEISEAKNRHFGNVVATSQAEFEKNPEFQEIAKMINAGATDTVTFRTKVRGFKPVYLDITKRAVIKELPFLNGTLNALYSQQGKLKAAPPKPKTTTESESALPANKTDAAQAQQTAAPQTETKSLRDPEERKSAFQKAVERSAARSGGR